MLDDYLNAIDFLTINDDKLTLQRQVAELTEKSEEENYIIKGKLSDREKETELLRQRDAMNTEAIANLSDQLMTISARLAELKKVIIYLFLLLFYFRGFYSFYSIAFRTLFSIISIYCHSWFSKIMFTVFLLFPFII